MECIIKNQINTFLKNLAETKNCYISAMKEMHKLETYFSSLWIIPAYSFKRGTPRTMIFQFIHTKITQKS